MVRDAVSATIVAGRQAQIWLNIEVNRNELTTTLILESIKLLQWWPFMGKATHPFGSMGSSNPRLWRGERLQHHGHDVY
jgi:hypothetical protein